MIAAAALTFGIKSTVKNQTEILSIGSPAPAFTLPSANREAKFSLSDLISRGAAIVEFLRGTW
jgi:peroxiredoxin